MTQAQVALMAPAPETWVALAVISAVGEARQSEFLDEALAFHRRVSWGCLCAPGPHIA